MIQRVFTQRVPATWTLAADSIFRHAAPGIFTLRLRSLIERTVSVARHAFVNGVIAASYLALSVAIKRGRGKSSKIGVHV